MIPQVLACATCAANGTNDPTNAGGYSILFMLGVVLLMLGGVSFFVARLVRRSSAMLEPELRDEPIVVPSR